MHLCASNSVSTRSCYCKTQLELYIRTGLLFCVIFPAPIEAWSCRQKYRRDRRIWALLMILVTAAKAPLEAEWSGHSEGQMEGTVAIRKTKKKRKKKKEQILAPSLCNADVLRAETLSCTGTLGWIGRGSRSPRMI